MIVSSPEDSDGVDGVSPAGGTVLKWAPMMVSSPAGFCGLSRAAMMVGMEVEGAGGTGAGAAAGGGVGCTGIGAGGGGATGTGRGGGGTAA